MEMAGVVLKVFALLVAAFCGKEVLAQTHHVVGGDDGWSSDLNVSSWLAGRVFRVGDKIWFRSLAVEDTIAELQSLEEFMSCDITNPIRMYTDGLNNVTLEKEGTRYFTSGNIKNCKNGMKLPVPVQPEPPTQPEPLPPIQPEPPLVPTPPEPVPIHPPFAIPPPPPPPPPPPSAATTPSNVLSFVYYGLFLSYFVL
ncbi:blue copper protein 1a-like [Primulina eburnea]|uniref:blue copper protein 1a-like n=1 Tax=Primulina eburnea TaxID=1245227 RepID=UPI003C6C27A7